MWTYRSYLELHKGLQKGGSPSRFNWRTMLACCGVTFTRRAFCDPPHRLPLDRAIGWPVPTRSPAQFGFVLGGTRQDVGHQFAGWRDPAASSHPVPLRPHIFEMNVVPNIPTQTPPLLFLHRHFLTRSPPARRLTRNADCLTGSALKYLENFRGPHL